MPKVTGTRKHKAAELMRYLENGPAYSENFDAKTFTHEQAIEEFKLWSRSWVIPLANELVPELRKKKKQDQDAS